MKTFSFQNDWRRFPHVVAFALLLLVAGCGGDDDDLGDQSVANGLWTGTIGGSTATAVLQDGDFAGFREITVSAEDEDVVYFVDYQIAEGDASLSGDDRFEEGLMLRATLSGTGAARTLTGTLGGETLRLTLADNNGDTADLSLLDGTWSDADTWTGSISSEFGAAMLTIDARGAFTGMSENGGCVYTGQATAEATPPPLYRVTMTTSLCADTDFNGDYRGYVFFTDGGQNDVLNGIAVRRVSANVFAFLLAVMERQ